MFLWFESMLMSPNHDISAGAPSMWSHPFQESRFMFSFKSATCARRRLRFLHSFVLCSYEYLFTLRTPKIYSECGDHPGYFDHNSVVLLSLLHLYLSIESGDPIFDHPPLEEVFPSHHRLVCDKSSCEDILVILYVTWGYVPLPNHLMYYMRIDKFCGPSPALVSFFLL